MLKIALICGDSPNILELQKSYALLLLEKGKGSLTSNDSQVNLISGRVFLLKENLPVKLEGTILVGHLVQFQDAMLSIFLQQFVKHRGKGLYDPHVALPYVDMNRDDLSFLTSLIIQLCNEIGLGISTGISKHYLIVLLRHVNRDVEREIILVAEQERLLTMLSVLLDEHYKDNGKATFYAKKMGMNSRQLNSFTHKHFGKCFFSALTERRIAEADVLLIESEWPIKVIAYELGFSNQNVFSVYFKRYRGYSPSAFRNRISK